MSRQKIKNSNRYEKSTMGHSRKEPNTARSKGQRNQQLLICEIENAQRESERSQHVVQTTSKQHVPQHVFQSYPKW